MEGIHLNKIYDHYKGGRYLTLLLIEDSTNDRIVDGVKNKMVVYVSLNNVKEKIWCRLLSEFIEEVKWPDGSMRPRFSLAGKQPYSD
tara:strand:+ start:53005 stop:53265 length:261 start_codon:yes stop_codon:yes gene_type:complete